jgi:uridine phosphorylase
LSNFFISNIMQRKFLPLTGLPVGGISADVLVCGDPGRAEKIARMMDSAELISQKREYRCFKGRFEQEDVTVCSHGIGAAGAAIAFEELIEAGGKRIIRIGTCGGLQSNLASGDLVIATAAVQNTGYGRETVPPGYPAVADRKVTLALEETARIFDREYFAGIVLSRDGFYRGVDITTNPHYGTMSSANVLAVEMECAALFIVGSLRRIETGAILAVDGNVLQSGGEKMAEYSPDHPSVQSAIEDEIQIALQTLATLNQ